MTTRNHTELAAWKQISSIPAIGRMRSVNRKRTKWLNSQETGPESAAHCVCTIGGLALHRCLLNAYYCMQYLLLLDFLYPWMRNGLANKCFFFTARSLLCLNDSCPRERLDCYLCLRG